MSKKIYLYANDPVSDEDKRKIAGIFRQSGCPHESLKATFPDRYDEMQESKDFLAVFFDAPEDFPYTCTICEQILI